MSHRRSLQAGRRLTLLSAGIAPRRKRTREQARQLAAHVDWRLLAADLRARRLLGTLGQRILGMVGAHAGAEFADAVAQSIEAGRRQGTFLALVGTRVGAALAEAGIRSAPLKGPALGEAIYGAPGRRLSGDVDVLVAPEQLHAAVAVVRKLGYSAPTDRAQPDGLPLLHFALPHERGELPPVELHWRVHWYERSFATERLLPPHVERSATAWRPPPAAELAALLLFYARDGFVDLRLAADLSAWWDTCAERLEPGGLEEIRREYPALSRPLLASAQVAAKVIGLPATRVLCGEPPLRLRDRAAVRLANPNPRASPAQLYADIGVIDGLLMPRGDFRAFLRRQVLPPGEVLEERARQSADRRVRTLLGRNGHLLVRCGVVGRYGLTATRLMRAPETA